MQRLLPALLVSTCLWWTPLTGLAWGVVGHQTVARIAATQLTPAARATVDRWLALEPGATLESIAGWADEHRDSSNTRWHYVNFPRGTCVYVAHRDCPDGQCVVAAIAAQTTILHSDATDAEKLQALKFLVHLVGDIHQPLHAGYGDDRGGNQYQIQYQGEGSNLHALWDRPMVEQFGLGSRALATKINREQVFAVKPALENAVSWAEQSCSLISQADFYPPRQVPPSYLRRYAPLVQQQLWRAGMRLAAILNTLH